MDLTRRKNTQNDEVRCDCQLCTALTCDMEDVICADVNFTTGLDSPNGATLSLAILPADAAPRRMSVQFVKSGGSVKSPLTSTDPAPEQ